jgi:hypothetical protein
LTGQSSDLLFARADKDNSKESIRNNKMPIQHSIVTLNDHFMVGSAASGHDFVQNMYGMYIRFEQKMKTNDTNLAIANSAYENTYKPLVFTSLGHKPDGDSITSSIIEEGQQSASVGTNQLLKISRDYKDVLVSLWKTWEPESTWDDFRDGPLGFELITAYEADSAKFVYDVELSYEELVKSPHRVLTSVVNHLLPRQDNPELSSFGAAKRIINLDCIDQVIEESMVRTLRDGESEGLLDSVGVYKQFLAPEEVDEVNEFIANL